MKIPKYWARSVQVARNPCPFILLRTHDVLEQLAPERVELAVPKLEGTGGGDGFIIPFDASTFPPTGGPLYTGFAIANLNPNAAAHVTCTARDQWGSVIPNAVTIPTLNPSGHHANYLFPALTGKRGTLECTADTLVSAIALRFIGTDAFSTLPVTVK